MTRLASIVLLVLSAAVVAAEPIVVASKNFNESYILGEAAAQLLESAGFEVERRMGLGGTLICYEALIAGEIDVYVEYTGTLSQAILKSEKQLAFDDLNASIAPLGLEMLPPVGFNNTYALAMPRVLAERLGLETVSDLAKRDDLDIAFSHEFLEREDGWPGLARLYGFDQVPNGIEHGLAYQALADGAIDVTDAYSTDGELVRYDLKVLADDRHFFPSYLAAPIGAVGPAGSRQVTACAHGGHAGRRQHAGHQRVCDVRRRGLCLGRSRLSRRHRPRGRRGAIRFLGGAATATRQDTLS